MSASSVSSYLTEVEHITFGVPLDVEPEDRPFMVFHFSVSPERRSLISLDISAFAWAGHTGQLRLSHVQTGASASLTIGHVPFNHTIDLAFDPIPGGVSEVLFQIQPGIQVLAFTSATFSVSPPVFTPDP